MSEQYGYWTQDKDIDYSNSPDLKQLAVLVAEIVDGEIVDCAFMSAHHMIDNITHILDLNVTLGKPTRLVLKNETADGKASA